MDENELWAVHEFYSQVAEYFNVDIEDTEYDEYGTYPNHIHKKVDDHKEAIRLLSGVLEQDTELALTELESWQEGYEQSQWAGRFGRISDGGYDTDSPVEK